MTNLTRKVTLQVTEEDLEEWKRQASRFRLSLSAYLRMAINDAAVKTPVFRRK